MPNRTYDLVVLLDADAPTDTRTKIVGDMQSLINQHGDVKANKDWGTRQLPYLIDHHDQAAYHVFQFQSDPESIAPLDRGLKLTEGVLRFRIYETDDDKVLPAAPPLFKREERAYERPPANVAATPELDETPAPPPPKAPDAEAAAADAETSAEPPTGGDDSAEAVPAADPADDTSALPVPETGAEQPAEAAAADDAAGSDEAEATPGTANGEGEGGESA